MFKKRKKIIRTAIKSFVKDFFTNRLNVICILLMILFAGLIYRLFILQIVEGEEHLANFNYKIEKTISTTGSRGNIYDCNGNLLAYSELAYSVTMESSDEVAEMAEERSEKENKKISESTVRNEILYKLIKILEENGDSIVYDLPLVMTSSGTLKFTESGTTLERFLKEIYSISNLEALSGDDLLKAEAWLSATPEEVYEYLRTGKNGPLGSGNMFDIDDSYSMEDTLKIMSLRYDFYMNRYSQATPITVANNVSEESIAAISEHENEMPGISIESNSLRRYNDAKYFSGIIGYTGNISSEEMEEYNEDGGDYTASDIVGKTGIEKTMEGTLRGKKGCENILVDNLGKVIKTVSKKEATSGNDVYLTIDADLQKYAYNILERRLAGIILANMEMDDNAEGNDIRFSEVLFALIDNNVIDIGHFNSKSAKTNEKSVYQLYESKLTTIFRTIRSDFKNSNTTYNKMSEENQEYAEYVIDVMEEEGLFDTSKIDETSTIYLDWTEGEISFGEYIRYAINNEWIDISKLPIEDDYYDEDTIFDEVLNSVIDILQSDVDFQKVVYKYMIQNKEISAKEICLILYDQGVFDKQKDDDYTSLVYDEISTYTFIYRKIYNLEITPAQLALDPCSGSVIITDPDTGEIRAMVSYPSYDNNKLANGIDAEYFALLNDDKSSPMLNQCTQTRTAPGSTFKPITATALLEENIITTATTIKCKGIFDKITPSAKCWIYPDTHKSLTVSGAIAVSCNYFFYEAGYRMGTANGSYDSERGLNTLKKYVSKYGLNCKSGVEITEYDPQISDEDAVRSSIGQGTHNYTPSQISRYLTSLINEKELLELSLLKKTVSTQGGETKEYTKTVDDKLDVDEATFDTIKKGMIAVVNGKDSSIKFLYENQGLKVAGKTGTAQENKNRPNHALFISYAPYDDPEITMTVVVRNGYTSANAAEIARDIYKYYFGKAGKNEKNAKTALLPSGNDINND